MLQQYTSIPQHLFVNLSVETTLAMVLQGADEVGVPQRSNGTMLGTMPHQPLDHSTARCNSTVRHSAVAAIFVAEGGDVVVS